jgi:multiple sugar transport system ATP-binding protein
MNFLTGKLEKKDNDLYAMLGTTAIKLPAEKANNPELKEYVGQEVIFGVRPEAIHDEPMYLQTLSDTTMQVDVDVTELMGAEIYLYLGFDGMEDATNGKNIIARVSSRSRAQAGDKITVAIDASRIHIFDKDTEKCICH